VFLAPQIRFPTCLQAKIFKKIFLSSEQAISDENLHKFIKKYTEFEKSTSSHFICYCSAKKFNLEGKLVE